MAYVTINNKRFLIEPSAHEARALLTLPGSNKRRDLKITMPLNELSWELLNECAGWMLDYGHDVEDWLGLNDQVRKLGYKVNEKSLAAWDLPDLWETQAQAIARIDLDSVCLFDDRGMGKTRVVIEAIRRSQRHEERSALVVCPKRLRAVWEAASELWWGPGKAVSPSGENWSAAAPQIGSATITIITYESLFNEDVQKAVKKLQPYWLVIDEAHNVKKRKAKNTKKKEDDQGRIRKVQTDTKSGIIRSLPGDKRIVITGSPAPNAWWEMWILLHYAAPDVFTGFWQFVETLGVVTENFWGGKEISPDIVRKDLWQKIYHRWIIMRHRPRHGTVWDFVPVELSDREVNAYRSMQEEFRSEKDNGEVLDAPNQLARAVRLQQLAGGLGKWKTEEDEEGRLTSSYLHANPSSKTDVLIEMLEGLDRAVVFTRFRNRAEFVTDRIKKELGVEVALITGGVSEKRTKQMLGQFLNLEENPEPIVAVCVYGTISEGVNELVSAQDIFLLDWSTVKDVEQAVDRLDRPGQTGSVRAVTLYSKGTIDELTIDREAGKVKPLREILRNPEGWAYLLTPIGRK